MSCPSFCFEQCAQAVPAVMTWLTVQLSFFPFLPHVCVCVFVFVCVCVYVCVCVRVCVSVQYYSITHRNQTKWFTACRHVAQQRAASETGCTPPPFSLQCAVVAETVCEVGWIRPADMLVMDRIGILQLMRHGSMRHAWRTKYRLVHGVMQCLA